MTTQETESRLLVQMATELMTRRAYMAQLGMQYQGHRDIYSALGYPVDIQYDDYFLRYSRQDIAARIVEAPVKGCWGKMPQILETDKKEDTAFEKAWKELDKKTHLLTKLVRLDKLVGIGRYAVLFLGYSGYTSDELRQPLEKGKNKKLLYVTPFPEGNAEIMEYEEDVTSERYGLPLVYRLTMKVASSKTTTTRQIEVHHSRVLHVAEGTLDDDIFGTPRLQKVWNRLMDLDKIVGGSGEMFWQGAFPGFAMKADADYDITQSKQEIEQEIDQYVHQLRRYMKLQGIDVQQLASAVADPSPSVEVQLMMISAATSIPKRILVGSERGELSSEQDEGNWNGHLDQRRQEFCDGAILRPLINKLIETGTLPFIQEDKYEINWPPLYIQDDKEKASVATARAEAMSKYVTGGLDGLMTFDAYLEHVCEYDRDVVDLIVKSGEEESIRRIREEEGDGDDEEPSPAGPRVHKDGGKGQCRQPTGVREGGQFKSCGAGGAVRGEDGTWRDSAGAAYSKEHQAVLGSIRIPPAWTNVEVNADHNGSPLVRGRDKKDRRVYITNPDVTAAATAEKWARADAFSKVSGTVAKTSYEGTLNGDGTAAAVLLTMKTGMRPGSEKDTKGAEQAFGVSTLQGKHVKIVNDHLLQFTFTGKKAVQQNHTVNSPALVKFVQNRKPGPNDLLFETNNRKMLAFTKKTAGSDFKTKDIRTWRATTSAARLVASRPRPTTKKEFTTARKQVAEKISFRLGNTPGEALKSYINPKVFAEWGF